MLSKPGEARRTTSSSSTPSSRRHKKVVEENLDDVVRKLQRLPSNKSCADCSSKHTQSVNLTHGSFVCMACSGIHREFNHKVKGIGASSFTATEVTQLRNPGISGNEAVNAKYLANYDARSDRMKAPQNNTDLQHLRSWIRMKYIDKVWCDKVDSGSSSGGATSSKSSKSSNKSNGKSKSRSESGRRKIMPEINNNPPAPAEPAPDLFGGFDSIVPTSAPTTANNNDDWDAFGGSSQKNSAAADPFQADFSNMNSSAPAPTPSSNSGPGQVMVHYHPQLGDQGVEATVLAPPSNPAPPANAFGNFDGSGQQQQTQPTMVSLPPAGNQMNNSQPQQIQQQPAFQANFDQAPAMPQQVPQQQQGGFANFPSSSGQAIQQTQVQPQPQEQSNNQGFDNFSQQSQMQPQMQQTMVGQQNMQMRGGVSMMANQQQTQGMMNNNQLPSQQQEMNNNQQHQMNFGQFPQQTQMQQPQQNNVQSSDGFANFSSLQPPQQVQPQINQQQLNQFPPQQSAQSSDGFANFSSIQAPKQPEQMSMGQAPQNNMQSVPSQPLNQPPQQTNIAQPTQETAAMNPQGSVVSAVGSEIPKPDQPPASLDQNINEIAQPEVNPNAFQNVDNDKKSLFDDAFGGLSLEQSPGPSYMNNTATIEGNTSSIQQPPLSPKKPATPTFLSDAVGEITAYKEGQQVVYTNSEGSCPAVIAKVHYDDELHPFYTINVQGREKQTDNAHLSLPDESNQNTSTEPSLNTNTGNNNNMMLEETTAMLQKLNSQQLMQVQQLVASLVSSSNDQNTVTEMNGITGHHQTQISSRSIDTSNLSMGNSSIPSVAMGGVAQKQSSPMPSQMQYNPQQQQMGMGSMAPQQMAPPSSMPPPPPQPPSEPTQQQGMGMQPMSQDQAPPISIQQQQMGALPTTDPTSIGMGAMNNSVPTPPQQPQEVEPMPEPEGNPFDLY